MTPRRAAILREIGLTPIWRLRSQRLAPDAGEGVGEQVVLPAAAIEAAAPAMPERRPAAPTAMPVQRRPRLASETQAASVERRSETAAGTPVSVDGQLGWSELEARIRACTACALHQRRKQAVPGIGDLHPKWLMVGEGPGAEEDRRGEPFVGPAGQLLDAMLAAVGLSRSNGAFIANSVKCRPPGNRTPEAAEIATCFPYLKQQVRLLSPRLIVALGRPAAQSLLDREVRIADARGRTFEFDGIPVVVTYHPAYLLRNPQDKAKAWEDLCRARALSEVGA